MIEPDAGTPSRSPTTNMLCFCCVDAADAEAAASAGLPRSGVVLSGAFEEARRDCEEVLLVVDARLLESDTPEARIAPSAIRNVNPLRQAVPVAAGGGVITRYEGAAREVLLIHRRGVWDLPKGKQNSGESIRECAVREVGEEVGIRDVRITGDLGSTVHGYPDGRSYAVKTTWWFAMETSARRFVPQAKEKIDAVRWFTWDEARRRLGFETLRRHLDRVEELL